MIGIGICLLIVAAYKLITFFSVNKENIKISVSNIDKEESEKLFRCIKSVVIADSILEAIGGVALIYLS